MTPFPTATFTPLPPAFTSTATIEYFAPTPIPTLPPLPIFTPDAMHVERWQEDEDALANALLSFPPGETLEEALCEWEILGRSDQEVFVWAVCTGTSLVGDTNPRFPTSSIPAVIHHSEDGSVQLVEIPGAGTDHARDIRRMFPLDVQERIFKDFTDVRKFIEHLDIRQEHPEVPPLVVLSATPEP